MSKYVLKNCPNCNKASPYPGQVFFCQKCNQYYEIKSSKKVINLTDKFNFKTLIVLGILFLTLIAIRYSTLPTLARGIGQAADIAITIGYISYLLVRLQKELPARTTGHQISKEHFNRELIRLSKKDKKLILIYSLPAIIFSIIAITKNWTIILWPLAPLFILLLIQPITRLREGYKILRESNRLQTHDDG